MYFKLEYLGPTSNDWPRTISTFGFCGLTIESFDISAIFVSTLLSDKVYLYLFKIFIYRSPDLTLSLSQFLERKTKLKKNSFLKKSAIEMNLK